MAKRYHTAKHAIFPPSENLALQRLRDAVRSKGGVTAVSMMADIPTSSLSSYVYGREMKLSAAVKIARVCSVSLEWLAGITEHPEDLQCPGKRPDFASENGVDDGINVIKYLTYFDAGAFTRDENAGLGNAASKYMSLTKSFLDDLGVQTETSIVVKVSGDSMEPTLRNGDLILVDTTPNEVVSGLHVIMINGRITVRRVAYPIAGGATLIADNKLYPSQDIGSDQLKWGDPRSEYPAVIIGRVIYRFQAI
ncbi:hypothetical protein CGLAMM_03775 [Acetobacteraceae bacterium EV16G]|uniref:Peptidase S24/S26A/S26B/S26C domain-containing protein n=1 Tax=Sorlinia euscelidii TaxID=3081148 RepID=A0ABU7U2C8_9PROT